MSAKYALFENPSPDKEGKKKRYHARIVSNGTVRTTEIVDYISEASSFSSGDIKGILDSVSNIMAHYLEMGYTVDLDELGTFSISLKCEEVEDPKKVRAHSVHFRNIHYQADKKLMNRLQGIHLEKAENATPQTAYTLDERKARALRYLEKHEYINRRNYIQLNGCSRATAGSDLSAMLTEGTIRKLGAGRAIIYVKA